MFARALFVLAMVATSAAGQQEIRYFAADATIDGSQRFHVDEVRIYPGVTVTMVAGDYRAVFGAGGDAGVIIGGGGYGGNFVMRDGGLDQAWFLWDDTFRMYGGVINDTQIGSRVPNGAEIFGGTVGRLVAINAIHIHGGTFGGLSLYSEADSWIYLFGDELTLENGWISGRFESGDLADYKSPGNVSIIRSNHVWGDVDFDGDVDLTDLNYVRNNFGTTAIGDANLNSVVDLEDLNLVRNNFGTNTPQAVPEPATLWLFLGLAIATLSYQATSYLLQRLDS